MPCRSLGCLLQLSAVFGPLKEAVLHLATFRCPEALAALARLPGAQVGVPASSWFAYCATYWVLAPDTDLAP